MAADELRKLALRIAALETGWDARDLRAALTLYREEGKLPTNPRLREVVQQLASDIAEIEADALGTRGTGGDHG